MLEINERGTWKDPSEYDGPNDPKLLKQDEDILQIARLVNCGWFGSAVFSDYFGSILGLVRLGSSWSLNPFGVCYFLSFLQSIKWLTGLNIDG